MGNTTITKLTILIQVNIGRLLRETLSHTAIRTTFTHSIRHSIKVLPRTAQPLPVAITILRVIAYVGRYNLVIAALINPAIGINVHRT
ncbi:MAG: hypothetical protein EBR59_06855 [Methylococcaceae bacterium]|nr:hypothetical protein [Methylococcaceae bacterium]